MPADCIFDLSEETGGFAVAFGAEGVDMPLLVTGFDVDVLPVVNGAADFTGVFVAGEVKAPCPFAGDIVVFGPVTFVAGVDVSFLLPAVSGAMVGVVGVVGVFPLAVGGTVDVTVLPSGPVPDFFVDASGDVLPFEGKGDVKTLLPGAFAGVPAVARSLPSGPGIAVAAPFFEAGVMYGESEAVSFLPGPGVAENCPFVVPGATKGEDVAVPFFWPGPGEAPVIPAFLPPGPVAVFPLPEEARGFTFGTGVATLPWPFSLTAASCTLFEIAGGSTMPDCCAVLAAFSAAWTPGVAISVDASFCTATTGSPLDAEAAADAAEAATPP